MRQIFLSMLLLAGANAHAQQASTDGPCPNPQRVKNLCMFVSGMSEDPEPLGNRKYTYQRRILEASCVDVKKDSKEVEIAKVQHMWQMMEPKFICNSLQFDVANGSILKLAAINSFDAFIDDVIRWKVNLNKVDETDGRTLLDYIDDHMKRTRGGEIEKRLRIYYDQLRKAGAKHRSELSR